MLRHFHPPAGWCSCSCSPCRVWFFPRIRRVNTHTLVFCSMRSSYSAHIEMKLFSKCVVFIYGERLKFQIDIVSNENMHKLHRFDRNQIKTHKRALARTHKREMGKQQRKHASDEPCKPQNKLPNKELIPSSNGQHNVPNRHIKLPLSPISAAHTHTHTRPAKCDEMLKHKIHCMW